ncbi:uncharacterized protein BDR25DRAFT_72017 [Lindgomyces ingoldianus]|uniref:Uncharacterized protein n=1 Tax=Lindgomyces ingoldianus TaxID=673940 RepID=A0ACB6QJ00_9PLEO|nr:uncharacterized protein BDR25DRAFT_72017 [Lindgomyces ingoldianus]KAF2466978.1 hypothetical protein BDR25DRAFT_72017 [Lindgomyces ingoldianus]
MGRASTYDIVTNSPCFCLQKGLSLSLGWSRISRHVPFQLLSIYARKMSVLSTRHSAITVSDTPYTRARGQSTPERRPHLFHRRHRLEAKPPSPTTNQSPHDRNDCGSRRRRVKAASKSVCFDSAVSQDTRISLALALPRHSRSLSSHQLHSREVTEHACAGTITPSHPSADKAQRSTTDFTPFIPHSLDANSYQQPNKPFPLLFPFLPAPPSTKDPQTPLAVARINPSTRSQ